jgi:signal peptidase I
MNIRRGNIKKYWKKFWYLIWKDESLKGWIFSLVILFVFIKFIFFPLLSLITGTALPLAIVESCSMYHDGNILSNYDEWWQRQNEKYSDLNIEKEEFEDFNFKNGFNKGDILFVIGVKPEKVEIGDVVIFEANKKNPLIHRVISIKKENDRYIFSTMGDNNNGQLNIEKSIKEEQLIGKAVFRIAPYIGWSKLIFFEYQKLPSEKGFCEEN